MRKNIPLVFLLFCISSIGISQTKIDSLQQRLKNALSEKAQLGVLDTLTKEMIRDNHPEQRKYLDQTIALAKKQGDYDLAASKTRFVAQSYIYNSQPDSAIYIAEEMLKHKPKFTTPKSEAHLLLKRAGAYFNKELLKEASEDYDASAELFLSSGDSIFAADARFFAGQVYTNLRDFLLSVDRFEEAYKLYDILGDTTYANYVLGELAGIYGRNKFFDKAIFERKKALEGLLKAKDYKGIGIVYAQLAGNFYSKKEYETSKKYADSALKCIDSISSKINRALVRMHAERINTDYYLQKNDLEKAKKHLDIADNQRMLTDAPEYYNTNLLLLKAAYYKKTGEYNTAKNALEELLAKKEKVNDLDRSVRAARQIAEIYAIQGDYKKAYDHSMNYIISKDSLNSSIKTNTFLYYQSQFEAERKDNEIFKKKAKIEILQKNKEIEEGKQKVLWIALLFIIIITSAISYFIWQTGKRKRKALFEKIKQDKTALDEFTSQLLDKSKIQEELTRELEELKTNIGEKDTLKKLQDLAALKILTQDDWYTFKHKFTMVYPTFFKNLKKKNYELTKSEERLLAMEKLDLDNTEIANMLAISPDSVIKSRSRLRKKINAPKGTPILKYLEAS
ncbi:tetratricopeptide repeat protein [Aquimarina sp. 2201CG14-23]|uniref:tetratricopeptide repeat protein n=1 Tax=Aquimarina mycalae TaxID=3040073 RepID=UPI002477CDCE|nr:hypothetical protein [Aquimarina sp. 2201CG14-23]MDH7447525.1 hypothetical protein [Aquimarina sp. 2201CG14-23]